MNFLLGNENPSDEIQKLLIIETDSHFRIRHR